MNGNREVWNDLLSKCEMVVRGLDSVGGNETLTIF
jgi:hypothetical protein